MSIKFEMKDESNMPRDVAELSALYRDLYLLSSKHDISIKVIFDDVSTESETSMRLK